MSTPEFDKGPIGSFFDGAYSSSERIERVREVLGEETVIAAQFFLVTGDSSTFQEVVDAFTAIKPEDG